MQIPSQKGKKALTQESVFEWNANGLVNNENPSSV
jgi:hypothetical protein